jgi:hypothetical protein
MLNILVTIQVLIKNESILILKKDSLLIQKQK